MAEGKRIVYFNNKREGYLGLVQDYLGDLRRVPVALRFLPRLLTSPLRCLPDFIVAGFPKCGTTSLYEYLVRHPSIKEAFQKETFFFDWHYKKGLRWYRAFFPLSLWKAPGSIPLCGEATAAYSTNPETYARIYRANPKTKLIILLRNPVERAYSNYRHLARLGHKRSFEETIQDNLAGLRHEKHTAFHDILQSGIYVDYIKRMRGVFPANQMLILKSEDFFSNPEDATRQCFEFLNLPPHSLSEYRNHNPGGYGSGMGNATRKRLEKFYAPHNRRLYEYLAMDFGWK